MNPADTLPLVVHVVYRFDVGGLENGIVNLINHFPEGRYRHAIVALTDVTDFRERISRKDVDYHALGKPPGQGFWLFPRLYRLFRRMRPAIVHTRNLAALEAMAPAWAAGVPVRIHGEHGRDVGDPDGKSMKALWSRRFYSPFVGAYVALSQELEAYLTQRVGIRPGRVARIHNGVDTRRFHPAAGLREPLPGCPFGDPRLWLVGTVGRMQSIKDPITLARAFILALRLDPSCRDRLRLVMVGEGPLRAQAERLLAEAGLADRAWLPGGRNDVETVMRGLDGFLLPSRAEGISNTVLEAMASGLPVIATAVGGNGELVVPGETGQMVPAGDADAMARTLLLQSGDPQGARAMGRAGRMRAVRCFSLENMVSGYLGLYDRMRQGGSAAISGDPEEGVRTICAE